MFALQVSIDISILLLCGAGYVVHVVHRQHIVVPICSIASFYVCTINTCIKENGGLWKDIFMIRISYFCIE